MVSGDRRRLGMEDGGLPDALLPSAPGTGAVPRKWVGTQVLLRGLPGTRPITTAHAVQSADWYHPIVAEILTADIPLADGGQRHARLAQQRAAAEQTCRAALVGRPRLLTQFDELLQVNQRYAVIREEQARDFTLAWPILRVCVRRLGEHMVATGAIEQADDVFFCTTKKSPAPFGL